MSANAAAYNARIVPCHAGNQTASSNGISIDTLGYETLTFIYQYGTTTTFTSATVDFTLEDSADDSSFAAITGAAMAQHTSAQNAKRHAIVLNLKGRRRYVRAVLTKGGTTLATAATGPLNNGGVLIATNGAASLPATHFDSLVHVVTA